MERLGQHTVRGEVSQFLNVIKQEHGESHPCLLHCRHPEGAGGGYPLGGS